MIDSERRFKGHDAALERPRVHRSARADEVKDMAQKKDVVTVRADWKSNYYSGPSRSEVALDGE